MPPSDPPRSGLITGPITLRDAAGVHDLRGRVWSGPDGGGGAVSVVGHAATRILMLEKKCAFDRLREQGFAERHGCVLVCGRGYPGRAFHRLLCRLQRETGLAFDVVADNDPGGYELFFLMARGAAATRGDARPDLAIPGAGYLGLRTADLDAAGLSTHATIELSAAEREQLRRLRHCRWLAHEPEWQRELDALAARGTKLEIEGFNVRSFTYLADTYLPDRLSAGAR